MIHIVLTTPREKYCTEIMWPLGADLWHNNEVGENPEENSFAKQLPAKIAFICQSSLIYA